MFVKLINKCKLIFNNLIMGLRSLFWRRDRHIIVFGSWFGNKFADNSRFLFQYVNDNKEQLGFSHVVWLTRNISIKSEMESMGYEVYMMDSPEGILFLKTAKVHIVCNSGIDNENFKGDIDGKYSFGAIKINLWHGVGNKRTGLLAQDYLERYKKHPRLYDIFNWVKINIPFLTKLYESRGGWFFCYMLCTSESQREDLAKEELRKKDKYIISDYPRHDVYNISIKRTKSEEDIIKFIKTYKHTIIYLPTFRSGSGVPNFDKIGSEVVNEINNKDILWIQKAHTADLADLNDNTNNGNNVLVLSPNFDINILLPLVDILITDYSSVSSDGLYFNKPVIYYVPDFDEYKNSRGGFIVEPDKVMPGIKAFNKDDLVKEVLQALADPDLVKSENYEAVKDYYWGKKCSVSEVWKDICKRIII